MSYNKIVEILGNDADSLLKHECKTIDKNTLTLPGGDFVDRVFRDTNRSNQVLRSINAIYSHGRLGGTGYVSILPVDQGIEHSAGASFAPNPAFFDPENIDIAILTLLKPLKSGESCVITTPFLIKIPKVFSRFGHNGQTYNVTQWYPKPAVYDINGWNPMPYLNQGEFYSEFGDFDVKISLPKNYIVAATGILQNENELQFRKEKGKNTGEIENSYCNTSLKTVQFKQSNIHDFAWFASKNFGILSSQININDNQVEVSVYSQNPLDLIQQNLDAIKIALIYYSENAGNYPYTSASVVKSELKAGGGMEYPMITVCDNLNKEVIIHEVGHNWFYGILGSNERRYPWMDESINSYFESQAMKPADSEKDANNKKQNFLNNINDYSMELLAINAMRKKTDQALGSSSADYTNINYGTMVYGKGSLIFKHLEAYLGKDIFKKCFRTYYETCLLYTSDAADE